VTTEDDMPQVKTQLWRSFSKLFLSSSQMPPVITKLFPILNKQLQDKNNSAKSSVGLAEWK